uniref:Secreted protein n=1 Tax=Haemonchus contortus TaxID=6289 RepID=A0A7I5E7U3_HAECO
MRKNSSCAIHFLEFPASRDAQMRTGKRNGSQTMQLRSPTTSRNPAESRRLMAQLFNVACSALVAVNALNDDRTTHRPIVTSPSLSAFPFCFDFIVADMSSECGWTNQRPVYL